MSQISIWTNTIVHIKLRKLFFLCYDMNRLHCDVWYFRSYLKSYKRTASLHSITHTCSSLFTTTTSASMDLLPMYRWLANVLSILVNFALIHDTLGVFLVAGEITSNVMRVVREARQYALGPFSPSCNVQSILLEGLEKVRRSKKKNEC